MMELFWIIIKIILNCCIFKMFWYVLTLEWMYFCLLINLKWKYPIISLGMLWQKYKCTNTKNSKKLQEQQETDGTNKQQEQFCHKSYGNLLIHCLNIFIISLIKRSKFISMVTQFTSQPTMKIDEWHLLSLKDNIFGKKSFWLKLSLWQFSRKTINWVSLLRTTDMSRPQIYFVHSFCHFLNKRKDCKFSLG